MIDFKIETKIESLKCDFYVPSCNLIIEVDGPYHYY